MRNKYKIFTDLINLVEMKDEIIVELTKLLSSAINENAEKENMINVLMNEFSDG